MKMPELYYKPPVFRPPSEANSLLIQATEGCTFRCTFCYPYLKKKFRIRPIEDIKKDIRNARLIYGDRVEKLFFLDGNAFVMKPDMIIELTRYAYGIHKNLRQVSAYAHAKDILRKSDEDLKRIAEAGFTMCYVGLETGDNELLKKLNKQVTSQELIDAAHKLYRAGILFSGTIIIGAAGADKEASKKHALATADMINKMNPPESVKKWYIAALTLMIPLGTQIEREVIEGTFKPQNPLESLLELKMIIENIEDDLHDCIFRSNHASNYLPLRGVLAKDKRAILKTIDFGIAHPELLRPSYLRGL